MNETVEKAASRRTRATRTPAVRLSKKLAPQTSDDLLEVDPAFAPVARAFAKDPQVTSGKMMSSFGLKVGGKIFAMMASGAFVAKLPKHRVAELVAARTATPFDPRKDGRAMKEWISVTDRKAPWLALAKEAYLFVKSASRKPPR